MIMLYVKIKANHNLISVRYGRPHNSTYFIPIKDWIGR